MKIIKIAILFVLFISNFSLAAVGSGWFDYALGKLGQDGKNALTVVNENGLILSRIKNDYAAFTLGEKRLSDEEQESTPIDVSEFDFVIEFETCNSTNELLSGTINRIRFRQNPSDVDAFVDEFLDIQKYFFDIYNKSGETKEATEDNYVISYLGAVGTIQNITYKIKISKEKHHIEMEASAPDLCVSN